MLAASLVVQVMIAVLLSVVGALLILLHLRIGQLRKAEQSFKILSESLEGTITRARDLMGQLKGEKGDGVTAEMQGQLTHAQETLQDLSLMSERAEKILERLDALEESRKQSGMPIVASHGKSKDAKAPVSVVAPKANGVKEKESTQEETLSTRPFSFTSQPLRTVTRGRSSALYQAASKVTEADDNEEEDVIKATRSEAEKRLKQALQGRI